MRLLILVLAACLAATPVVAQTTDNAISVTVDDPQLAQARRDARASLPQFWSLFERDPSIRESAMIKVTFVASNGNVHWPWVDQLTYENGVIKGRLANRTSEDIGYELGDEVTVDPSKITDWAYWRGDVIYGGFTLRVLHSRKSAKAQAESGTIFSDPAVEP